MADKMRCERVEELAAPYALYAALPDEVAAIEAHISGCDKHADVAELLATAQRLSALPDEMEPPPELKTRVMAAVNADVAAERTTPAVLARAETPSWGWFSRLFASRRGGFVLAGALAAIVAVLIVTNPFSSGGGDGDALVQSFDVDGIAIEVSYVPGEDSASIDVEGMEPAPEGQVYQVWAIVDGAPASIGFLPIEEDGTGSADLDSGLASGQTVAVTVEPDGGSPLPTTDPVFGVEL
jgi:anti-sigma-K factor RskA